MAERAPRGIRIRNADGSIMSFTEWIDVVTSYGLAYGFNIAATESNYQKAMSSTDPLDMQLNEWRTGEDYDGGYTSQWQGDLPGAATAVQQGGAPFNWDDMHNGWIPPPPAPPKPPKPPIGLGGVGGIPPDPGDKRGSQLGGSIGHTPLGAPGEFAAGGISSPLTPPAPVEASGPGRAPFISPTKLGEGPQPPKGEIPTWEPPATNPMGIYSAAGFGIVGPLYPRSTKSTVGGKAVEPMASESTLGLAGTAAKTAPVAVEDAGWFGGMMGGAAGMGATVGRVAEGAAGVGAGIALADGLGALKGELEGRPGSIADYAPAIGTGGGGQINNTMMQRMLNAFQKMSGMRDRI